MIRHRRNVKLVFETKLAPTGHSVLRCYVHMPKVPHIGTAYYIMGGSLKGTRDNLITAGASSFARTNKLRERLRNGIPDP